MLNNEAVELYYQRFVGNSGQFYEQKPDGSYRPSNRPLTFPAVWSHLSGSITIGFPAVDSEGFCRWICFDDDHFLPADATGLLDRIEVHLVSANYHCLREGKRPVKDGMLKQGHLWIFLDRPIQARIARAWALSVLSSLKIDPGELELFPKQDAAANLGNCVRGPLGRHAKAGGERGWFRDAPEDVDSQLEWLAAQPLNQADRIIADGDKKLKLIEARERYRNNFDKPARTNNHLPSLLEMMLALGQRMTDAGDRYQTQCPVCAAQGHDKSKDNLHISKEESWFGCWYGGWMKTHTGSMIYQTVREKYQAFKGIPTKPSSFSKLAQDNSPGSS